MRPLGNNLLVKQLPFREPTGGITVPDAFKESLHYGDTKVFEVLSVGPGRLTGKGVRIPIEAAPGDRIVAQSHTDGTRPAGDDRIVINAETILAVIPK